MFTTWRYLNGEVDGLRRRFYHGLFGTNGDLTTKKEGIRMIFSKISVRGYATRFCVWKCISATKIFIFWFIMLRIHVTLIPGTPEKMQTVFETLFRERAVLKNSYVHKNNKIKTILCSEERDTRKSIITSFHLRNVKIIVIAFRLVF